MKVPDEICQLLGGFPNVDAEEQAFPFLTVDEAAFPHTALLSRSELDVSADRMTVLVVVASTRTRANLERDGRAALIAIDGPVAHYTKLRIMRSLIEGSVLGCAFEVVEHKRDSLGIPLTPITFRTSADIARLEDWNQSHHLLGRLDLPI